MENSHFTAYLAPIGFLEQLMAELEYVTHIYGRLVLAKGAPQRVLWAQNIWYEPQIISIKTISDAKKFLCAWQRNWWPYSFHRYGRMRLIQEQLPHVAAKPLTFLGKVPQAPLGSWTLIDSHTLLAAARCESPMPNGEYHFNEDKENPPSRAYLKLWEFFTRFGVTPKKSDVVIDLGASPGGWTYVLAQVAGNVIACDRSALDPRVQQLSNVSFHVTDAFKFDIDAYPQCSWIFSDVVCYPEKLYDFIEKLLKKYPDRNYVFTIKFQGSDKSNVIKKFADLPGKLVHLSHNKHELTWFNIKGS